MTTSVIIKRTTTADPDFSTLITHLDNELWNELKEDQATYDQYNSVPDIKTAVVIYVNGDPAACGCFKQYGEDTVEVKRMFVEKPYRGQGLSKTILEELEKWAMEFGFLFAILETSIHFKTARTLYGNAGYEVIPNYDQYEGLTESVCMRKKLNSHPSSEFKNVKEIEYFDFEEDFVEREIRCIPMIVRFKMDHAGIKLKLSEWSKFGAKERITLATMACNDPDERNAYRGFLEELVRKYTGKEPTALTEGTTAMWAHTESVPELLKEKLSEFGWSITATQWGGLSDLQRFALVKLCQAGHDNKNLVKAMNEFNLISGN